MLFKNSRWKIQFCCCFSFFRESVATTQMATGQENDYDGSTEEESENLTWSSLPSGKADCIVFGEYHGQANLFTQINRNEDKILPDKLLNDKPTCRP